MNLYSSKPEAYLKTRYISLVGDYDNENVVYQEGLRMGSRIIFDSRSFVMPVSEFEENFVKEAN